MSMQAGLLEILRRTFFDILMIGNSNLQYILHDQAVHIA